MNNSTENLLKIIQNNNNEWNNVLEIGCGVGRLLVPLADKYNKCNFYGIDISDKMLKLAPKRKNIYYQNFKKNKNLKENIDFIYSVLVFQDLTHEEKIKYIKLSYKHLKLNGILFFQFLVGEENTPGDYFVSIDKIKKELINFGFKNLIFTNHLYPEWMFVKATK